MAKILDIRGNDARRYQSSPVQQRGQSPWASTDLWMTTDMIWCTSGCDDQHPRRKVRGCLGGGGVGGRGRLFGILIEF